MTTTTLSTEYYNKVYSKKLLEHAVEILVMDQFGQKVPFPKHSGSKTMRFLRGDAGDKYNAAGNVQTAVEGVPIAVFRSSTLTAVDCTLVQYAEAIKTSDILGWTDLYNTMEMGIRSMGEDAALHADFLITTEVVSGVASGQKRYSGTTSWANLAAGTAAAGKLTITDVLSSMTQLQINRAPKAPGGEYVIIVCPQTAFDMMQDAQFVAASEYGTIKGLFTGEVGRWFGVRVIVATQPWREDGTAGAEGTFSTTNTKPIFANIVTGSQAYGVPIMAGQSPFSPSIIICDKPDKSDVANQFVTAAWKAFWVAKTLNDSWSVIIRSRTTYT